MNVTELFTGHDPNAVAFVCGERRLTFGDLTEQVATVRANLAERVPVGSTVAVVGESSIEFIEVAFGALSAGCAVLPLHPRYPRAELERAFDLAHPTLVVATDETSRDLVSTLGGTQIASADLLAAGAVPVEPADLDPEHPALLLFTSGTSASPRIAVLSHKNVAASLNNSIDSAPSFSEQQNVVLGVMPLTHVLGLVSVVGLAVAIGSTTVLCSELDVDTVARSVEAHQVNVLIAPPVFWYRLANSDVDVSAMASVTLAMSGAAPLPGSTARALAARFGFDLRQGYGLTEASPGLTTSIGTAAPATSVGRPLPGVQLRLVDEFGDDALVGDVGELWARGDNIFAGYLGDPASTAEVIDDQGWLHTGDLAVVDENGFLYIVGRNKDQIIVSGFNVNPGEVEEHLTAHADVEAAAVVGSADREHGEVVVAYIVGRDGASPEASELASHCRDRLAGYKVPSRFEFVDELPRGATGKIRRRVLRSDA